MATVIGGVVSDVHEELAERSGDRFSLERGVGERGVEGVEGLGVHEVAQGVVDFGPPCGKGLAGGEISMVGNPKQGRAEETLQPDPLRAHGVHKQPVERALRDFLIPIVVAIGNFLGGGEDGVVGIDDVGKKVGEECVRAEVGDMCRPFERDVQKNSTQAAGTGPQKKENRRREVAGGRGVKDETSIRSGYRGSDRPVPGRRGWWC